MSYNFTEDNIKFLKWIDQLKYLPVFAKWRFEGPNIIESFVNFNEFVLDKPTNKFMGKSLMVYTDGSFNRHNGKGGCGVYFENKLLFNQ